MRVDARRGYTVDEACCAGFHVAVIAAELLRFQTFKRMQAFKRIQASVQRLHSAGI